MVSTLTSVHHIGVTVADLNRALGFWEPFLGVEARWRMVLDRPYLGQVTGYDGVRIDAAVIDLPGGGALELLAYLLDERGESHPETARPGNVHIGLATTRIEDDFARSVELGATPVSPTPVEITDGPNRGAKACYLRVPDGVTLELFQTPRAERDGQAVAP